MSRRSNYYRRSSGGILSKAIFLGLILVAGIYYGYRNYVVFDPQKVLDDSILKEKTFETNVKEIKSPRKGIKAYLFEDKTNPIISIDFMFKNAGLASDDSRQVGIANMAAALLTDGAGEMDSRRFKEELEKKAIGIGFDVNMDDFSGSLLTTKENAPQAYEMLKLVLTKPRFDADDILRVKEEMLVSLKQQQEHPSSVLGLEFAKDIYKTHPYARNPLGNPDDIRNVSREQLVSFTKNHFTKNNLLVGIAGDISEAQAGGIIDEIFGDLPDNGKIEFVREAKTDFDGHEKNISQPLPQTVSMFANKGAARADADFYPLYIINHIFGGSGLGSRLSMSAREDEALTYSVYSYLSLADKSPLIRGGFSSTPENFARVKEIIRNEWQKMGRKGISGKELQEAKNYLISSYNLRFASIADISAMLVYMQKDNLGLDFLKKRNDYVKSVTLEEANQAAKKFFDNKNLIFVNIGKF